jgi:hypothetical protein
MPRSRWIVAAAALAMSAASGCAHCDTCDDFPTPCAAEGGCGAVAPPMPVVAPTMGGPVMMGGPAMMGSPAPIVTSQPLAGPPSGSPAAAAGGSGSGSAATDLPPLPNGGGTQPFAPPARR